MRALMSLFHVKSDKCIKVC